MSTEEWRPVAGASRYEVSNLGRVRVLRKTTAPHVLKPWAHVQSGYLELRIRFDDGRATNMRVHRLVMETFVGLRPVHLETRHLDGDKCNNALSNLRYGTHAENSRDQVEHGSHWKARRVSCDKGHAFDEWNTHVRGDGARVCRRCAADATARYRAKRAIETRALRAA